MRFSLLAFIILFGACSSPIRLYNLNEDLCTNLVYGQIETRRLLTDLDKTNLEKQGMVIQDYIFENIYQGVWKKSFEKSNLNKTPIVKLSALTPDQKVAGGTALSEIEKGENRNVVLILQSIGPMAPESLSEYGKITAEKNSFIKMETGIKNVLDLSKHPCIKNISILEAELAPDLNKD
ncbi:MAG: hypothetical protein IPM48_00490 [Saprospiraceae bacterium]|nr:hypothetical protein [Saprospiraceae bacterium]